MQVFDSHVHIFNPRIIENVIHRGDLIQKLSLKIENIENRLTPFSLIEQMQEADVIGALMLPTSDVDKLAEVNRSFIKTASRFPRLYAAGTLHPDYEDIEPEMLYLSRNSAHVIKLCSFSQKFSLSDPKTIEMFDQIQSFNDTAEVSFSVVLDTLTLAEQYFGTNPAHTTTPEALMKLVRRFPGIKFIGAHMGGLGAPYEVLSRCLEPEPNLYLDTSNAAYTLTKDQFIKMLHRHGSGHTLFGTDWPWFTHKNEIELLDGYMEAAGFTMSGKQSVFSKNIMNIIGIPNTNTAL